MILKIHTIWLPQFPFSLQTIKFFELKIKDRYFSTVLNELCFPWWRHSPQIRTLLSHEEVATANPPGATDNCVILLSWPDKDPVWVPTTSHMWTVESSLEPSIILPEFETPTLVNDELGVLALYWQTSWIFWNI